MLSPALGAATAIWLMLAPVLEIETGPRAHLAVAVGVIAFVLSPIGVWNRAVRTSLAFLGLALAFINFALPISVGALADFGTCSVALIVAGVAPWPVVASRSIVVPVVPALIAPASFSEDDKDTVRLQRAA